MKNIEKFITVYGQLLVDGCVGTGLFPSVLMGQIIQESSGSNEPYGLSLLAAKYNNYAGIKSWPAYTGNVVVMATNEVVNGKTIKVNANFCHFNDIADFVKWRKVFLTRNARYKNAGVFSASTPLEQITALKKAGYATDPNYVSRVYSHITDYNLFRLDEMLKKKV